MEVTPEAARRQAFRQATDWFILLQEEPQDRALRRRFEAWRDASPVNAEAWRATERTSEVAAAMTPAFADEWAPAVAHRRSREERPRARRWSRQGWSRRGIGLSFAATAVAACLAMLAAPAILLRLEADHATGTAELRPLNLEDGSRVTLAPSSAVAVAFSGGERRVRLLEGQAFFEVRPDPARPFRVQARKVEASVLGTSFDVRLDGQGVTVAVQEGVVQVASPGTGMHEGTREGQRRVAERLGAGDSIRVAEKGTVERSTEPPPLMAAWRQGQLLSHDRPLSEAVDMLRRYWGGTIVLTDGALAGRTVTGVYNLADPEEALRGIAQTHGGKVRRITPWLLVMSGS
jgi:transmembrane sensor